MKSMSNKRLIIVGGVAGGASAAARARRLCEDCEIIMFERGPHVSFANCGLPYFVGGEIAEQDSLLVQTPESLKARFNLDVRINTEVIGIDRAARRIRVRELDTGREYEEAYDALILSTGASPLKPPIPGIDRPNHFMVRNIPDVEQNHGVVERLPALSRRRGRRRLHRTRNGRTTAAPRVRRDAGGSAAPGDDAARPGNGCLAARGVACQWRRPASERSRRSFEPPSEQEPARASIVVLKSGQRLPADSVVLGLGVKPEVGLAREGRSGDRQAGRHSGQRTSPDQRPAHLGRGRCH